MTAMPSAARSRPWARRRTSRQKPTGAGRPASRRVFVATATPSSACSAASRTSAESLHASRSRRACAGSCGLAPMYRTYRSYLNHVPCNWLLADLPNFPFHYAKYTYHKDRCIEGFVTIDAERFRDPLRDVQGSFDFIVMQEVFEHLDDPVFVASYLIDRLKDGGCFLFDYIKSEGRGLDTPVALAKRIDALKVLDDRLTMIEGHFAISDKDISRCVGRKI